MKYPINHNDDGNFELPNDELNEIENVIRCILTTIPGQHPRLPDFGNHALPIIFGNPGQGIENHISGFVRYDIERWEPRVKVYGISTVFDYEKACYVVNIEWNLKGAGGVARQLSQALSGG